MDPWPILVGEHGVHAYMTGNAPSRAILSPPTVTIPHDAEEDSRLQMNKIRAQLIGAFKEQMEMRRSLVELENTNIELHIDMSRHLLTIAE